MKVFIVNVRAIKKFFFSLKWVAIILLIAIAVFFGVDAYRSSNAYISAMQELSTDKVIIIDAGHGGEDPGAIGTNGSYEKDINLALAFELGAALENEGYAVVYTRTEDKLLYTEEENIKGIRKISDLKNRCKFAAEYPNAIFISIHMNSYSSSKYSGLQVYYSKANENSYNLASKIQTSVKSELQVNNDRVIKSGEGIYVLENITSPAVLIECGFMTNPEECEKLSKKEYRKQLSLAIVCGIIEYVKTLD